VAPKNERQKCNRNPAYQSVFSAVSKKEEEEGTAQKDGTSESRKTKEGKVGVIEKTFE
jgi:hypothetical protein